MTNQELEALLLNTSDEVVWVAKYINLVTTQLHYETGGEQHHILPRCMWPEFSKLSKNPWNRVCLSLQNHFMAHYYLYRAFPTNRGVAYGLWFMLSRHSVTLSEAEARIFSSKYADIRTEILKKSVGSPNPSIKGTLVVRDATNNCMRVQSNDPRLLRKELKPVGAGPKNMVNKVRINKDGVEKGVPEGDVPKYLSLGWSLGRIFKFSSSKGHQWMNFNGKDKLIPPDQVEEMVTLGWSPGRLKGNFITNVHSKGRVWVTNGIQNRMVTISESKKAIQEGWSLGCTQKHST